MAEGYKAWTGGQVLDAQDLTDYCSAQAVMRFANAAGRDAALTVAVVKEGMLAYLKDTNTLTVNTDGTTTGWVQIYPVVTSGITDSQVTNAKLAASSVSSTNIIDGTITGTDIASGTITGANIQDGSIGPSDLAGGTYSISISGNAATATSASSASSASTANYANSAGSASSASTANYANSAGSASSASTAGYASSAGSASSASTAGYASSAGTAGGLSNSGATIDWTGSRWNTDQTVQVEYLQADFGIQTNPITYTNYATGSSSTTYCVIRSSDNQIVTRSGTSLRATKTGIEDISDQDALQTILQLRPRTFRFRDEFVDQEDPASIHDLQVQKQYGLVVEEVLEVNPELIHHDIDKDGNILPKMWKDQAMIALLIGAVKNQQTQIDALVARLDALEASHAH